MSGSVTWMVEGLMFDALMTTGSNKEGAAVFSLCTLKSL